MVEDRALAQRRWTGRGLGPWIGIGVLALAACPSCAPAPAGPTPSKLTAPDVARRAVASALEEWRTTPGANTTSPEHRSVLFVDEQRRPGQKLRDFEILGSVQVDHCWRYVVRLVLDEPEESMLAAYFVFSDRPVWVYRAEDFDMMMHMDYMGEEPPPAEGPSSPTTDAPDAKAEANTNADDHAHDNASAAPPSAAPVEKAGAAVEKAGAVRLEKSEGQVPGG